MEMCWLSSYPRSGNTYLRTILWHCLGMRSTSVYPNDLEGRKDLENYVGHIEQKNGCTRFPQDTLPLVKTHERPLNNEPTIYVVRDGRASCVSLWHFFGKKIPLEQVIEGQHHFGTWTQHFQKWNPPVRPDTLLIRYEDLIEHREREVCKIAKFLNKKIKTLKVPSREKIASNDGIWVRKASDWKTQIPKKLLIKFNKKHETLLSMLGY